MNYYNEIDPFAAQWLRELIKAGAIAQGEVDERSIIDVEPADLRGFTQCHWFAGIGTWSYALRLAGWADDRPVWTGSPPCQPFSNAGSRRGVEDERHLAPHFLELVAAVRPAVVFGEQVAAAVKKDDWLDDLLDALERENYATGAAVLPACGVGAPHIRQRLWFVAERLADTEHPERWQVGIDREDGRDRKDGGREETHSESRTCGEVRGLDYAEFQGQQARLDSDLRAERGREEGRIAQRAGRASGGMAEHCREGSCCYAPNDCDGNNCWLKRQGLEYPACWLAHTESQRCGEARNPIGGPEERESRDCPDGGMADAEISAVRPFHGKSMPNVRQEKQAGGHGVLIEQPAASPSHSFWGAADWLFCRDGKWRPVEPGTFPLADGSAGRVGRLRGYGNGIVAQAAAEVIRAYMDSSSKDCA